MSAGSIGKMTLALAFRNGVAAGVSDDELLACARIAAGKAPEIFVSASRGKPAQYEFTFPDGSILTVDLFAHGVRNVSVS